MFLDILRDIIIGFIMGKGLFFYLVGFVIIYYLNFEKSFKQTLKYYAIYLISYECLLVVVSILDTYLKMM